MSSTDKIVLRWIQPDAAHAVRFGLFEFALAVCGVSAHQLKRWGIVAAMALSTGTLTLFAILSGGTYGLPPIMAFLPLAVFVAVTAVAVIGIGGGYLLHRLRIPCVSLNRSGVFIGGVRYMRLDEIRLAEARRDGALGRTVVMLHGAGKPLVLPLPDEITPASLKPLFGDVLQLHE